MNAADTSWILTSTALVLLMTLPGLALFYAGLVQAKNILSVLMQCMAIACLMSILWLAAGYSIAFGEPDPVKPSFRPTLPEPARSDGRGIHLPGPSWWPLIVAIGILLFMVGFMLPRPWAFPFGPVGLVGFVITLVGIFKWAYEPPDAHATPH